MWCSKPLPKRRRKYCSDECGDEYFTHYIEPLWRDNATKMALKWAGYKCEECGSNEKLEVHHIEKLGESEPRWNSPKNRQDNLKVLCRSCHENAHRMYPASLKIILKEQMVMDFTPKRNRQGGLRDIDG